MPDFRAGRDLVLAAVLGLLNPGISYSFSMLGLDRTSASQAALLWATEPLMILVLAAVFLREQVTPRLSATALVGFAGAALVARPSGGADDPLGFVLLLVAVALCAVYTVFSRGLVVRTDALALLAVQHGAGLVWATGLAAATTGLGPLSDSPHASTVALAALTGFRYYGLSYWLYLLALRRTHASVAGAYFNLIPLFALLLAAGFLGESLAPLQWAGAALILGAALSLVRETLRREGPA